MGLRFAALAASALFAFAPVAAAQQTFTSVAGPWWFSMGGKDSGALLLEFSEPNGAALTVTDVALSEHPSFGFSTALGDFFQITADQPLTLDSKGNVTGALVLHAPGGGDVGTLTFVKGKPGKKFTKLSLTATLDVGTGPLKVNLNGVRPTDFPVLSGHTADGGVSGQGVKDGKNIDLQVASDTELGLPAYSFDAHGPLTLDKLPVKDSTLSGRVMVDPKFKALGVLEDSSDFGTGPAKGKLKLASKTSTTPKLSLAMTADRKVSLKGSLTDPIEPVLSVTPMTEDYGAVHLGSTVIQGFEVRNVGVGTLSGSAALIGDSDNFEIIGSPDYTNLAAGDPPETVFIAFHPVSEGAKSGSAHFGLDTLIGARTVTLKGMGGIPMISVDPDPIAFLDTVAGATRQLTVTVTNDGDATLNGRARLSNANAFALVQPPNTIGVSQISYSIAPGDSIQFDIRFAPGAAVDYTGTLNLTGGDGKNVNIMGSGI